MNNNSCYFIQEDYLTGTLDWRVFDTEVESYEMQFRDWPGRPFTVESERIVGINKDTRNMILLIPKVSKDYKSV